MKRLILISCFTMLLIAGSICSSGSRPPNLEANCLDEFFELRGEINSEWSAQVVPDTQYQIIVSDGDSVNHPIHWVKISVTDFRGDSIANGSQFNGEQVTLDFMSPASGEVIIMVYSQIGDGVERLGRYMVKLCRRSD